MQIATISVYPLKGCRPVACAAAELGARGLDGDRRWMCVDPRGRFVTQREVPGLARLVATATAGGLDLALDGEALHVETPAPQTPRRPVVVWNSELALPEAAAAGAWLSQRLGVPVRLVHQPDDAVRTVEEWGAPGDQTSLSDGFPVLVASSASLDAFNSAGGLGLPMTRFRPNLVVAGAPAWAEDGWARLRVGACEIELVKPCARCTVTTVNQDAGRFDGDEPITTLRRIRMSGNRRVPGVLFGWNAIARRTGRIRVGDAVEVLETRTPWPIRGQSEAGAAAGV